MSRKFAAQLSCHLIVAVVLLLSCLASLSPPPTASAMDTASAVRAFGDSITMVASANPLATESYVNRIAASEGWQISNQAVSSAQAADIAGVVYSNAIGAFDITLWLCGYVDMHLTGTDPVGQAGFQEVVRALAVWLTAPDARRTKAQDANVTYSGQWNNSPYYSGLGKYSSTPGDTASFTTTGTVAYIAISRAAAASSGQMSLTVVNQQE